MAKHKKDHPYRVSKIFPKNMGKLRKDFKEISRLKLNKAIKLYLKEGGIITKDPHVPMVYSNIGDGFENIRRGK